MLNLICQDYLCKRSTIDPGLQSLIALPEDQNEQCRDAHIQSLVARFQLYSSLLSGIFSAIVTPYLGLLSDRIGRRKTIACSTLGLLAESIITIVVASNTGILSVYTLLIGSLLEGLCGSFTAAMSVSMAYASDCTPPDRRNVAIGYFYGVLFAGIAIGPLAASVLMNWTGTIMIVFYTGVACHVFFICFVLFVIPESVSKARQRLAREKHRVTKESTLEDTWLITIRKYNLFEPLWILRPHGPGTSPVLRRNLCLLASIDTIIFGVAMGSMSIILIYPQYLFGWNPVQASQFLSISNISRVFALFVAVPLLTRIFRGPASKPGASGHRGADMLDIRIIQGAVLLEGIGYAGYASAMTGGMMVAAGIITSVAGIGSPTLASTLTAHVPADRTGQVLGALGLLHALARVIAPTLCNTIYSLTVGIFTPTVFVCLASMFIFVFILSLFLKPGGESLLFHAFLGSLYPKMHKPQLTLPPYL